VAARSVGRAVTAWSGGRAVTAWSGGRAVVVGSGGRARPVTGGVLPTGREPTAEVGAGGAAVDPNWTDGRGTAKPRAGECGSAGASPSLNRGSASPPRDPGSAAVPRNRGSAAAPRNRGSGPAGACDSPGRKSGAATGSTAFEVAGVSAAGGSGRIPASQFSASSWSLSFARRGRFGDHRLRRGPLPVVMLARVADVCRIQPQPPPSGRAVHRYRCVGGETARGQYKT
jgi:hypothetical protein